MIANPSQAEPERVGRRLEAFVRGEWRGILPAILRLLLAPLGLLYGAASTLRLSLWRRGLRRRHRLPLPVLSVGNLTVGGTGKTPFVRWLCAWLVARGHRPLVLSRGYGARAPGDPLDEEGRSLQDAIPELRVAQGGDRAAVAARALAADPTRSVVVLDDGLQHPRLERDLDLLLVDAASPFGNGLPLPAGPLRELPTGAREADAVIATRADRLADDAWPSRREGLESYTRCETVVRARHRAARLLPGDRDPAALAGRRVWLASGIADPSSFVATVRGLGADVRGATAFRDHHAFTPDELHAVARAAAGAGAELLVVTGKDEPKLRALAGRLPLPVEALEVAIEFDPEDEARLGARILQALEGASRGPSA